jgi:hypothetical protein
MLRYSALFFVVLQTLLTGEVVVQFDPSNPEIGPYPTDFLTVPDSTQLTGRRVNLPLPNCDAQPSLCTHLGIINQLDGFNVQPRLRVRFSGPVDTSTLGKGIFFVALDNLTSDEVGLQQPGDTVPINQAAYDPAANTVYAKPDAAFDQHRRYMIVVTDGVRDATGNPVAADPAFAACVQMANLNDYCASLAQAVAGVSGHVVSASIFTTLSATAWLQSARAQLQNTPIVIHRPSAPYVFSVANLSTLAANFDTGSAPPLSITLALDQFAALFGNVGRIAFASYQSPQVLNAQQTIDPAPSGVGVILPVTTNEIPFHAYLPKDPAPAKGYPVVIYGHGFGDSSFGGPTIVSPVLAQAGFATVSANAAGHGFGPRSNVVITDKSGNGTTILSGGRGVDLDGNGIIGSTEGCLVLRPAAVGLRDCFRQTVVDLMQLVRVIQAGVDLDGDGVADLDGSRIYYVGQSLGSLYGTMLNAVEPAVRAAVLNVGGGSVVDIARWSDAYQSIAMQLLNSQMPPLPASGTILKNTYPFRNQPVKINDVSGASEAQNFLELLEWLQNQGDPIAFATHLQRSTLPGVQEKSVLWQIARADRTMPNPASSNLILTAGMAKSTWMYRHDLASAAIAGQLPQDPHPFLALFLELDGGTLSLPSLAGLAISLAAQNQVAGFFASDGKSIPDPNQTLFGFRLFEAPAVLPEDLGY